MNRRADLTQIVNTRTSSEHLTEALYQSWEWQGHRPIEAYTSSLAERRQRRRDRAEKYGIHLRYDGD
jgi:hypothetical protein